MLCKTNKSLPMLLQRLCHWPNPGNWSHLALFPPRLIAATATLSVVTRSAKGIGSKVLKKNRRRRWHKIIWIRATIIGIAACSCLRQAATWQSCRTTGRILFQLAELRWTQRQGIWTSCGLGISPFWSARPNRLTTQSWKKRKTLWWYQWMQAGAISVPGVLCRN